MRCAVQNCNNDNDSKASAISFFAFPTDPILQKEWISFCCRKENFNLKTSVICMEHFQPEDFANKLQYDMGFTKRRLLNQNAVPSIKKLPPAREKLFQERQQRIEKRKNQNTVRMLIEEYEAASALVEETHEESNEGGPLCSQKNNTTDEIKRLKTEIEFLHRENAELNKANRKLETHLGVLSQKMEKESKINKVNMHALKIKLMKANYELNSLEEKLLTIFTKGQISKLKAGNKRRLWSKEDIAQSITLYRASGKLYRLLYRKQFPLPAVSTLQKWAQKVLVKKKTLKPPCQKSE